MERKDALFQKLDEDQAKSSDELYTKLNEYLKKYNKEKNYSFVLGFQKGGGILFANDSLNVTNDVVKGLNEEYNNKAE
jgi:outer membrane protein